MDVLIPYLQTTEELKVLIRLMQGEAETPAGADRERLSAMIRKNRLEPLAADRLTGAGRPEFDDDESAGRTMRQISALGRLARLFAGQGIRVLSVKGPALAMEIYGTPGMRQYHDLDLLVERSDVERSTELLLQDGWTWYERDVVTTPKRRSESLRTQNHYLFMKGELCVELHWRLVPWDCDLFEALWAARREVRLGGAVLAVPGAVHQLHHLVCHGARHGFHRMKWLADLVVLLPRHSGEMESLWSSLAQCGQEISLLTTWALMLGLRALDVPDVSFGGFSLRRTEEGVKLTGPESASEMLLRTERVLKVLTPLLESAEDTEYSLQHREYRKILAGPETLRTRLRKACEVLRPRPIVWQWVNLPDSLYWLYWVLRPVERLLRMMRK